MCTARVTDDDDDDLTMKRIICQRIKESSVKAFQSSSNSLSSSSEDAEALIVLAFVFCLTLLELLLAGVFQ